MDDGNAENNTPLPEAVPGQDSHMDDGGSLPETISGHAGPQTTEQQANSSDGRKHFRRKRKETSQITNHKEADDNEEQKK